MMSWNSGVRRSSAAFFLFEEIAAEHHDERAELPGICSIEQDEGILARGLSHGIGQKVVHDAVWASLLFEQCRNRVCTEEQVQQDLTLAEVGHLVAGVLVDEQRLAFLHFNRHAIEMLHARPCIHILELHPVMDMLGIVQKAAVLLESEMALSAEGDLVWNAGVSLLVRPDGAQLLGKPAFVIPQIALLACAMFPEPGIELTEAEAAAPIMLELADVAGVVRVQANGRELGVRIVPDWSFSLDGAVHPGRNEILVEVAGTLGRAMDDFVGQFLPISPTGIDGAELVFGASTAA